MKELKGWPFKTHGDPVTPCGGGPSGGGFPGFNPCGSGDGPGTGPPC